jgi:polysaccharide deacetylase family sporulation protein PdaB
MFCVILAGGFFYYDSLQLQLTTAQTVISHKELPVYSVDTDQKVIAITFDSAWGTEDLADILEILQKHQVVATFFVTGDFVENYPEEVKMIVKSGHELGNHGDTHAHMTQLSREEMKQELEGCHQKVQELTGISMELMRPPYGDYNDDVILVSKECGYYPIQWSIDSLDWKDYGVEDMIQRVTTHKELKNGAIVLLHNGTKYTKDALDQILTGLEEQGYTFISVSKLLIRENYTIDATGRQMKE